MPRNFAALAVALAVFATLGICFVGPATAQPLFTLDECTSDDGYRGLRPCSAADGN